MKASAKPLPEGGHTVAKPGDRPRVSIVMPTYKRAHLLRGAIESVLAQSCRDFELIIVDDHSPDNTPDVVAGFDDPRIRYVRNDPNLRLPRALNRGFALARGDYLTWTSDDNFYAETAIERLVDTLQAHPDCDLVYADYFLFSETDSAGRPLDIRRDTLPDTVQLQNWNHIGACFMYTRRAYEVVGDYDPELFLVEDYDYFIRIARQFRLLHLAEPLYYFRRDDATLYLSRFAEVKASDVLVRYKNALIDEPQAVNTVVSLIARQPAALGNPILRLSHRYAERFSYRLSQLHQRITQRYLLRRLEGPCRGILASYRSGSVAFGPARDALKDLMQRHASIEYRA